MIVKFDVPFTTEKTRKTLKRDGDSYILPRGIYFLFSEAGTPEMPSPVFLEGANKNSFRQMVGHNPTVSIRNEDLCKIGHLSIDVLAESVKLTDLNSTNGTFINDERIATKEISQVGNYPIRAGDYKFNLLIE